MGILAKTDAVDARVIAEFAATGHYQLWTAPSPQVKELAELAARRLQLVEQRTAEQNRRQLVRHRHVRSDIGRAVAGLKRRITGLDRKIADLIASSPYLSTRSDLIASVPGAGPQLVAALCAYLPELGNIGNKQIAALVGVAPLNRDSGKYVGKRFVWGGRGRVRAALYMSALVATRFRLGDQGLLRPPGSCRQTQEIGPGGLYAQTLDHPQCHAQARRALAWGRAPG